MINTFESKREGGCYHVVLGVKMLRNFSISLLSVVILGVSTLALAADPIVTDSTSNSTVTSNGTSTTTVKSPPPSAISPGINASNSDLCTVGVSGAVQTQIIGLSTGATVRDMNCEMLKLSKTLYDMGMKVAAVSMMCQDDRVYRAMEMAGTPCPFRGSIGQEAQAKWDANPQQQPVNKEQENKKNDTLKGAGYGALGIGLLFLLL